MKHLLGYSVYQSASFFGRTPRALLEGMRCDGLELLTSYDETPADLASLAAGVHLPYTTDWLAAWEGRPHDMDDESSRIHMYGRTPEEIVSNLALAVRLAAAISPPYGVLHLTNIDAPLMRTRRMDRPDSQVISAFCEVVNRVVSSFPKGEPPFTILFENLWWPGLRMLDCSGPRLMEKKLEFSDWGLCLDTGHLMSCIPGIRTEQDGIEAVRTIVSRYDRDVIDKIKTVHLHYSASGDYRDTFEECEPNGPIQEFLYGVYGHVSSIDRHLPFSDPGCRDIVEILDPEFVTHEMPGSESGPLEDFIKQRSLLDRRHELES